MKSSCLVSGLILSSILLVSCTSIKETIYLQDVEVKGPMNPPPISITKDKSPGTLTLSPRIAINQYSEIWGNIGTRKYVSSSQDSVFRSSFKNLFWKMPKAAFGLDFDFTVFNGFAVTGGLNYSTAEQNKLLGGSLGISLFKERNASAIRFNAGILVQELYFDAKTIVERITKPVYGNPDTTLTYYFDRNKNADVDIYVMLTYNTTMKNFPINFFISAAYYTQTILDFNPRTTTDLTYSIFLSEKITEDARGEASSSYLSAVPGIFIDLNDWSRLVLGARMIYDIGPRISSRDFFILPVIQLDTSF